MVELSPNAQAWAAASLLGNPSQSVFASSSRAGELLEGFAAIDEQLLGEIPSEASGLERTLWIFSELLRALPPYSEPMNFPFVTEGQRRELFSHFACTYSQCVSDSFVVMPADSAQWQLTEDYAGGTIWWTAPSEENFQPVNFYSGQVLSPVFSQHVPLFESMTIHDLFYEGDVTEISTRISDWTATDKSGMRVVDPPDSQRDIGPILRIDSARDFVELTEAYPLHAVCTVPTNRPYWELDGYEVLPHWAVIAREYSGVLLGAEAYLDSAWKPLQTKHGTTRLSGWIPEIVYLLRNPWMARI